MSASCRKGSEVGKLAEFEPTKKQRAAIGRFSLYFRMQGGGLGRSKNGQHAKKAARLGTRGIERSG